MAASSRDWRLQAEILELRHKLNALQQRARDSDDKQNEQGTVGPTQMQSTWCKPKEGK
jgi:hypothetical protein